MKFSTTRLVLLSLFFGCLICHLTADEVAKELPAQNKAVDEAKLYGGRDFDTWRHLLEIDLDPNTRREAIKAIGVLGQSQNTESAYKILTDSVQHPDSSIAQTAIIALAGFNDEGTALLGELLLDEMNPYHETIIRALGDEGPRASSASKGLFAIANSPNLRLRRLAYDSLLKIGKPTEPIVELLRREIGISDDPHLRRTIIYTLADSPLDFETKQALLMEWLGHTDSQIRYAAATVLSRIAGNDPKIRESLLSSIRAYAVDPINRGAFPNLQAKDANVSLLLPLVIEVVEEDLKDERLHHVRFAVQFTDYVGDIGEKAAPAVGVLIDILDLRKRTEVSQLESNVIESLGKIGPGASSAIPSLKALYDELSNDKSLSDRTRQIRLDQIRTAIARIDPEDGAVERKNP